MNSSLNPSYVTIITMVGASIDLGMYVMFYYVILHTLLFHILLRAENSFIDADLGVHACDQAAPYVSYVLLLVPLFSWGLVFNFLVFYDYVFKV